jgi:hypothetical protein
MATALEFGVGVGGREGGLHGGAWLKVWFFVVQVMDISTMKKLSPCQFFEIRMHQLISTLRRDSSVTPPPLEFLLIKAQTLSPTTDPNHTKIQLLLLESAIK